MIFVSDNSSHGRARGGGVLRNMVLIHLDLCAGVPFFRNWCGVHFQTNLGGGNSNIFYVHPLLREMIQFDYFFLDGLKAPTRNVRSVLH